MWIIECGGVQGQGKGQRLMTTFGWQHEKVESMKSNPPRKTQVSPYSPKVLSLLTAAHWPLQL